MGIATSRITVNPVSEHKGATSGVCTALPVEQFFKTTFGRDGHNILQQSIPQVNNIFWVSLAEFYGFERLPFCAAYALKQTCSFQVGRGAFS